MKPASLRRQRRKLEIKGRRLLKARFRQPGQEVRHLQLVRHAVRADAQTGQGVQSQEHEVHEVLAGEWLAVDVGVEKTQTA